MPSRWRCLAVGSALAAAAFACSSEPMHAQAPDDEHWLPSSEQAGPSTLNRVVGRSVVADVVRTFRLPDGLIVRPGRNDIAAVRRPAPDEVSAHSGAECTFSTPMHFTPGISPRDGTGLIYASDENFSGAEQGVATCVGTIGDDRVTGTGTFGFKGKWTEGNCEANKGAGGYSFTVPTTGGTKQFAGKYAEQRLGLNGTVSARQPEGTFTGVFDIIPTGTLTNLETCHSKPITEGSVVITGRLAKP